MICYNFSLDHNKLSLNRPGVYLFLLKIYAYLIINFDYESLFSALKNKCLVAANRLIEPDL